MKTWQSIFCECGRAIVRDDCKEERIGFCCNKACDRFNIRFVWPSVDVTRWWPGKSRGGKGD